MLNRNNEDMKTKIWKSEFNQHDNQETQVYHGKTK